METEQSRSVTTPRGMVTIRLAAVDDAPAYRDLRLEALHNHPEAFSSDYAKYAAKPPAFWTARLRSDDPENVLRIYLAVHDGQLVGTCGIARTDLPKVRHSAYIVGMYVRPAWRGWRIADALVDVCLDWARSQEITIVKLGVAAANMPAIRCYARCGFQVYGLEPQAVYHGGVFYDELLMARAP